MYQGTNKTALTSQKQIADALFSLMEERPYADVTVCAICDRANVSRQTFYSLFRSKENVVRYALQKDFCYDPEDDLPAVTDPLRPLCRGFSRYILDQAEVIRTLSDNQITQLLHGILRDSFLACGCFLSHVRPEVRPYAADFLAAGLTSIARTFTRTGAADAQALEDVMYILFHGDFFRTNFAR